MKVLVVDDEPPARRRLQRMLKRIPEVEVAEARDGIEALQRIRAERPDLVLLDIRMPGLDGLALASSSRDLPPIVFTTAYDEHAVEAFEVRAVDYLLKPVKQERLREAVERVRAMSAVPEASRVRDLLEELARGSRNVRISARSGSTVRLFDPRELARLHASAKYVVFQFEDREFVLDESLTSLEARLADFGFLRVHRSELVNLNHVRALHGGELQMEVVLADGQRAPVSRRCLPELRRRLGIS